MDKQSLNEVIEQKSSFFCQLSEKIWEYAELKFAETRSAALLCETLEQEGFAVERGIAGISTAFVASFGSGNPVVALLGEYDALSGLSQKSGVVVREPLPSGMDGHGCGHNLLGVGALAAAVAVKQYLAEKKISGTVRYYGCPGEEGGSGKTFMARDGVFDGADIALTWHPMSHNTVFSMGTLANFQVAFRFHGRSSHAGSAPHLGRSALDAVELMNVGVNYLREHIIQEARIHYAVTNSGGFSPNVVQSEAESLYLIRAPKVEQVREIYERVCNIAKGAALMTETDCEIIFEKGCSNYLPNRILGSRLLGNFMEIGVPQPDERELRYAAEIQRTLTETERRNDLKVAGDFMDGDGKDVLKKLETAVLSDVILPCVVSSKLLPGSTDVGDVSWIMPTAQLCVACQAFGTPGHSWQVVAQGTTTFAHKAMLTAARVLAATAVDVLEDPSIVAAARREQQETMDGALYVCPVPFGVKPKMFGQ